MQGPFRSLAPNLSPCFLICPMGTMVPGLLKSQRCGGTLYTTVSPLGTCILILPRDYAGSSCRLWWHSLLPIPWEMLRSSETLMGP